MATVETTDSEPAFDRDTIKQLALLASVVFIAVVNGTMINIALPYVGDDFGVSEGTYGWLVTGYSLSFGIFNAINGRLADVFGKKRMYMFGLAVLGLGSIATALAPSIGAAIAIRLVQGAGAAALPVLGTTIIGQTVASRHQGRAVGVIMSTVGVAASIGPFLGGLIVEALGWRWVFGATGISLLAIPFAYRLLPDALNASSTKRFDWVGAVLMGAGVSALLYGFELLESQRPWWWMALLLAASAVCLGGFWAWIVRHDEPFISPRVFAMPGYVASCAVGAISNAARFASVVLASISLTKVNGLDAISVGMALCPGAVAVALLSSKAGAWADRTGPRQPVALGLVCLSIGAVIAVLFAGGSAWGTAAGLTFLGIGYALAQSPLVSHVNRIVPRSEGGAAVGVFMMVFFIGGAAGVASAVTIVELRRPALTDLFGVVSGPGSSFGDAYWMITALGLLGLFIVPYVSPKAREGTPVSEVTHAA